MLKGLSSFVSHVLALAISIIILSIVAANLFGYYGDTVEQSQRTQARLVSGEIGENIIRLYTNYIDSDTEPMEGETLVLGKIRLSVPEKISGRSYIISLRDNDEYWIDVQIEGLKSENIYRNYAAVKITTMNTPGVEETYNLNNIGINLEGRVRKTDEIVLKYIRNNTDGTLNDKIVMERI
ncbi:MAG: hypothetical protein ABEK17_00965 [Candidatus Aenigmatarchaeota archaeon]